MNNLKIFCAALLVLFISPLLYSQDNGTIQGKVTDSSTGEELIGVNVYLEGTHTGAATDDHGYFLIKDVPSEECTLVISMLRYESKKIAVEIKPGETIDMDIQLEPTTYLYDDVVVTATRSKELVMSIPVSTEVINSVELKESNARNVGEALQSVGASIIKNYGAIGSLETISLRGSTDSQVLILVDGQRINNAQSGSVDLSHFPVDIIERIEVVKGGHAALYGSDAVGGVINIITKSLPRENKMNVAVDGTYGSFNTQIYDASVSQGIGSFDYLVSYNRIQSDGNYEYTNLAGEKVEMKNGDTKSDDIFVKAGYLFADQSKLSVFHKYRKANNGSPGSIDYPNLSARNKINNNQTSLSYEGFCVGRFAFNFKGYMINNEHRYIDPENYMGLEESIYYNDALGFIFEGFTGLDEFGVLSYGYEFRRDKLESHRTLNGSEIDFLGTRDRNVHSVYLQEEWQKYFTHNLKTTIVPAVRLDKYPEESVGQQITPKVGINLSYEGDWKGALRGNVGRVFRAPSYNDLYWPEDTWTKGNPDLKPEKGITYDFGVITQFKGLGGFISAEATYFASNLNDLIIWAPGVEKWMPENVAKATINGIETKLKWGAPNNLLNVEVGYTYMNAKDDGDDPATSGKYLIYRPKSKFDAAVNFNYDILNINLYYNFVGKRFHDAANTTELDSYSLVNANLGIHPMFAGINWILRLEVNNLLDKEITVTQGVPVPGREIRIMAGLNTDLFMN